MDLIGDIEAAGLRTDELSDHLIRAYSKELEEPRVAVIVRSFGGQVFVGGEVNRPAALSFSHGLTALQAIQGAGGFTVVPELGCGSGDTTLLRPTSWRLGLTGSPRGQGRHDPGTPGNGLPGSWGGPAGPCSRWY